MEFYERGEETLDYIKVGNIKWAPANVGVGRGAVGCGNALQAGLCSVRFPMDHWDYSLTYSFRPHYGPGVDSASNKNEGISTGG